MITMLILATLAMQDDAADTSKRVIERPLKSALGAPAPAEPGRVAPGRVRWHASPAAAVEAAAKSGRPVLIFQMLGRLDDEWC